MVLESLFGGLLGGLFRLAPEVIKFFDRKDERKHELNLMGAQLDYERLKGEFKVEEKYVDYSVAHMDAVAEAYKQQAVADSKAYKWVASLSALVRPGITFTLFGLYVLVKLIMMYQGIDDGVPWQTVITQSWKEEDWIMLNMVLSFYFLNRSIDRYRK